ncbi:major facilitator superfamily domain-containing protein [Gongronella butleri]|nr:major facilitator superfamily domain-containing protein [Gongronella butleri]
MSAPFLLFWPVFLNGRLSCTFPLLHEWLFPSAILTRTIPVPICLPFLLFLLFPPIFLAFSLFFLSLFDFYFLFMQKIEVETKERVESDSEQGQSIGSTVPTPIITPAEKKLRRKIMFSVLPFIWMTIFVNFVDKAMLSVAAVNGLITDLKLVGDQYSWISAIVYLGYLVYQVPNNYLMQRLPLAKYMGALLILWGIVVMATAFGNTFQQMMALRFLLGLFESGAYPVIYLILNTLFRRSEQPFVYGFVLACSGTGTIVGTCIGYAVIVTCDYKPFGSMGIWRAWRWGYFIYGWVTIGIGMLVFLFLADDPYAKIFRLTEEEKKIVAERIKDNMVVRSQEIKRSHMWEALKEFRFWAYGVLYLLLSLQNSGMVAYSVIIIQSLGFTSVQASLLQIPSGATAAIFALLGALAVRLTNQRIYVCCAFLGVAVIGFIVLIADKSMSAQLGGYYITWAYTATMALQLNIVSSNVGGYTKKIFYSAFYVVLGTIGSFAGPFMMKPQQQYIGGYAGFIASNVVAVILLLAMRWEMSRENKRRLANPVPAPLDENGEYKQDLTDKENKAYIYKL